jgi:uncharacterized Fe-S cluster-containing protein
MTMNRSVEYYERNDLDRFPEDESNGWSELRRLQQIMRDEEAAEEYMREQEWLEEQAEIAARQDLLEKGVL